MRTAKALCNPYQTLVLLSTASGFACSARCIGVECALAGAAYITIFNRDSSRGEALAKVIASSTSAGADLMKREGIARIPEGTDILINATSVGLHPHSDQCPDVDFDSIRPGMTVCDVVFNPVETPFLNRAAAWGAKTIDGLGMLVNQGYINFGLWTGQKPTRDVICAKLKTEFGLV